MSKWEYEKVVQEDRDMRIQDMPGHKGKKSPNGRKLTDKEKRLAKATPKQVKEYIEKGRIPD